MTRLRAQSIADFPHDSLLQWLNEVNSRIPARHFRSLQVQIGQFPSACHCLAVPRIDRPYSELMPTTLIGPRYSTVTWKKFVDENPQRRIPCPNQKGMKLWF